MFHLALYAGSIATGSNVIVPAITDQILTIQDQGFLPQRDMDLVAAFAFGVDLQHAYLVSPSSRVVTNPYIRPTQQGATFPTQGEIADYRDNPFRIEGLETLTAYAQHDNVGAQVQTIGILLRQNFLSPPIGKTYTMRGTSVTAATANAWSDLTMTWESTLPAGRYAVTGLQIEGASSIAARLLLEDQQLRPGCIAASAETVETPKLFRKGRLGLWGHFTSTDMPNVQVYATAATAAWTVYLDIIRVSRS